MAKPSNCRARGYEIGTGGGNIRAPPMISSCNFFFFANANNGNSLKKVFYLKCFLKTNKGEKNESNIKNYVDINRHCSIFQICLCSRL
jgi:hypothetical protein